MHASFLWPLVFWVIVKRIQYNIILQITCTFVVYLNYHCLMMVGLVWDMHLHSDLQRAPTLDSAPWNSFLDIKPFWVQPSNCNFVGRHAEQRWRELLRVWTSEMKWCLKKMTLTLGQPPMEYQWKRKIFEACRLDARHSVHLYKSGPASIVTIRVSKTKDV